MSVKFAIQTVPSREDLLGELQGQLPAEDTVTYVDRDGDYMEAYIGLLRQMRGEPFVRLEDDVELCNFFVPRITAAIGVFQNEPINFFYLRGKNKTLRPEVHPGSDYCMGQCIYIPGWLSCRNSTRLRERHYPGPEAPRRKDRRRVHHVGLPHAPRPAEVRPLVSVPRTAPGGADRDPGRSRRPARSPADQALRG